MSQLPFSPANLQALSWRSGDVPQGGDVLFLPVPDDGHYYTIEALIVTYFFDPTVLSNGCDVEWDDGLGHHGNIVRLGLNVDLGVIPPEQNQNWTVETSFSCNVGMRLKVNGGAGSCFASASAFGFLNHWTPLA
jgi:hypothetical protein